MTKLLRLPLPTPDRVMWQHGEEVQHFTANQMRDYGVASSVLWAREADRLRAALDRIAEHTGSDDPCRHLVQIARDALETRNDT